MTTHDLSIRFVLAALAAATAALPAQPPAIRDSAGIQIVYSSAPSLPSSRALRMNPKPTLVIGNREGIPHELARVRGAARLANGSIVVADGGSTELRLFDSSGAFVRTIGRKGGGPGEFAQLDALLHLRGDTLAAIAGLARATYFDGTGAPIWNVNHFVPPVDRSAGMKGMLGAFADGSALLVTMVNPQPRARGSRWLFSTSIDIVDRTRGKIGSTGDVPFSNLAMDEQPTQPWFTAPFALANNDAWIYAGLGTEYSIRQYQRDGKLVRIIRRAWTPVKVTQADINRFGVDWGKRWIRSSGAEAERERAQLRNASYEKEVPAFSRMLLDATGRLWVRTPDLRDAPRAGQLNTMPLVSSTWSIFDQNGRWLSNITLPAEFQPYEIGADYILAVARDSDGVETVALHGLEGGR